MKKALVLMLVMASLTTPALAEKTTPYWASIAAGEARMRTGPGRQFPASWLYKRANLPVKVIKTYPNWRQIEDPDGTKGWMQANLLSDDRTAIVRGETRAMRDAPRADAKIIWRAEQGVVGKITECAKGWCKLDVTGRMGFIETAHIWGTDDAAPAAKP